MSSAIQAATHAISSDEYGAPPSGMRAPHEGASVSRTWSALLPAGRVGEHAGAARGRAAGDAIADAERDEVEASRRLARSVAVRAAAPLGEHRGHVGARGLRAAVPPAEPLLVVDRPRTPREQRQGRRDERRRREAPAATGRHGARRARRPRPPPRGKPPPGETLKS